MLLLGESLSKDNRNSQIDWDTMITGDTLCSVYDTFVFTFRLTLGTQ